MTHRIASRSIILIILVTSALAQDTEQSQVSVRRLIDGLQSAITNGSQLDQFFSPSARAGEKAEIDALANRGFLQFQIVDYTLKDLRFQDARHATLPVTVKWSTRTEEASRSSTLRFVKEQDTWYFEHADFWEVSLGWFFAPLITLAIAYGISAVVMNRHISRQQWISPRTKLLWQGLSIIPLAAFLYFVRKPWIRVHA